MSNKSIGLLMIGGLVSATLFSGAMLSMPQALADTITGVSSATASVTVLGSCSMTANPITAHTASIVNGTRQDEIGDTKLEVFCNDPSGFAIYAAGYSNNTYRDTDLIYTDNTTNPATVYTIPTGNALYNLSGGSSWGIKITVDENTNYPPQIASPYNNYSGTNEGYYAVPDEYTKIASLNGTTAPADGSAIHTTYAAFIEPTQAAGTYDGQVRFILVHPNGSTAPEDVTEFETAFINNGVDTKQSVDGEEYYRMQDMTTEICSDLPTGAAGQLVDTRDTKLYWILKAKDGHCWMTQNLDLNLDSTMELNSTNTNLEDSTLAGAYATGYRNENGVTYWKPSSSTILPSGITNGNIAAWSNDQNAPQSVDPGDFYWTDTWYGNTMCTADPWCNYLNGNAGTVFKQTAYSGNGEHGHVGNYYNWSAAIASNDSSSYASSTLFDVSGNPKNSICPKGWRLPTIAATGSTGSENYNTPQNEFYILNASYTTGSSTGDKGLTTAPLFFVRGGYVGSKVLLLAGYYGYYWSSTVDSSTLARYLGFNYGGVNAQYSSNRYFGWAIRCLVRYRLI